MRTRFPICLLAVLAAVPLLAGPADAAPARRIDHQRWDSASTFGQGHGAGVDVVAGRLELAEDAAVRDGWQSGRWTSPWVEPGFDLTELIPSWEARTPGRSLLRVEVRGRAGGSRGSWDTIARWALGDRAHRRTTGGSQTDDLGRVAYDTWVTRGASAWQLRVTLRRPAGAPVRPSIGSVGAVASRIPSSTGVTTSRPGGDPDALGTVLRVPRYSQMVHEGTYPQYDGGGEAWCSPTSTTMVLAYHDALPPRSAYRWVDADHPDRVVVHAARMTYDVGYGGTGTWPFNTAYAASLTGDAFVTRLRSLRGAERYIGRGVPLVASVSFGAGDLDGAPISSTNGHLLVIVGFQADGDVVVNDPAAPTRAGVRRVYDRGQFEDAWLKRGAEGGSGGLVYVVTRR